MVSGFSVHTFAEAVEPCERLLASGARLAILSADLQPVSGLILCQALRQVAPMLPILFFNGCDDYRLRTAALNAGADDAMSFPFALEEFTARIHALLRRVDRNSLPVTERPVLLLRDLVVDAAERCVTRCGVSIRLTVKEYDLLLYLMRNKQQVCRREDILHAVWGETWVGDDNLLDVYIRYLRKKIERPDLEPLIHTIRGVGFVLR